MRARKLLLLPLMLCVALAAHSQERLELLHPVTYTISLKRAEANLAHVTMQLGPGQSERVLHLPVWNALYQVRDFAQYVRNVRAVTGEGKRLVIRKTEKSTWRLPGAERGATVEYDIMLDMPGSFGAQVNREHAFLNLAMVLMFTPDTRGSPAVLRFTDVNPQHRMVSALPAYREQNSLSARNYDHLVDSPVEIGPIRVAAFRSGKAAYRVAVHSSGGVDMDEISSMLKRIVDAGVWYMQEAPFDEYLFLYHFPERASGGGMEHAYSTAIELSHAVWKTNRTSFNSLTAHEFFHLWNVKRIRPSGLEPVDYLQEDYTDALWFCEGVTSTVAEHMLIRAALMKEDQFLERLAGEISDLENRLARLDQSAAESSLETWLDKYPAYRLPQRSVNYYNKGLILGVLLDLEMRETTGNRKSLRDLFHWLNQNLARRGRTFDESAGLRDAAEAVTGTEFDDFFARYVTGTEPLPYERLFATVGLRLQKQARIIAHAGFTATRNFDEPPVVAAIDPDSDAAREMEIGDIVLAINGDRVSGDVDDRIARLSVGSTARIRVSGRSGVREVKLKVSGREMASYRLVDVQKITPAQRARRRSWLMAETEAAAKAASR